MVIDKLDTFIDEIRSGKREGSVVTYHTTDSLSADAREAWRQLRKELESVGITPARFNQHHDIIITRLQEAIENGDLIETLREELSNNTCGCNSNSTQGLGDRFSNAEDSEDKHLVSVDYTCGTVPQPRNLRTNIQPPTTTPASPIKEPSRITKLLSRITNGGGRLRDAAILGIEPLVRELLKKGANINSKDQYTGRTPLSWAAWGGHTAVIRLLLETDKVDVDSGDIHGRTPLSWAAEGGHEAVVRLLLETGEVDVNSKAKNYKFDNDSDSEDQINGGTPLSWVAARGHETVVKLLLETDAIDIDSKDYDSWTPFLWAAARGHEAVVKLLLKTNKIDANFEDRTNRTPLLWAAKNGYEIVVKLLLERGEIDIDSKDYKGRTPLFCAAENGHETVVRLLLETGKVDIGSNDYKGETSLSCAVKHGHKAIVRLLSQPPPRLPPSI